MTNEFQKRYALTALPTHRAQLINGRIVRYRGISLLEYLAEELTQRLSTFKDRLTK